MTTKIEENRLLKEGIGKQARKINARNRIIDAAKNIALNSTIPSSAEHNRFAFVLIEDYMELADAYLEYKKTT